MHLAFTPGIPEGTGGVSSPGRTRELRLSSIGRTPSSHTKPATRRDDTYHATSAQLNSVQRIFGPDNNNLL